MVLNLEKKKKWDRVASILFPLFLFLYPLRHIRMGVEWGDTGYNYGNFIYMDHMDDMWMFSTYLANVVGNFFSKLPFGNTMMGLNFYTGLSISVLALAGYYFFVKEGKLPKGVVFVGEFLAISMCWCPTALLYNYLTYLLLGAGFVLLYYALTRKKGNRLCFVLAGICLGINVFVRFSNLANMALIVAVWAMGIIRKEKFGKVVQQTLWCVLGYTLGLGGMFGLISLKYGPKAYMDGVLRLLTMPSEASSYTITSMVMSQIKNYQQNLIWIGCLAGFLLLGMIVYQILPKSCKWVKNIGYLFSVFCSFHFLRNRDMFNYDYTTKESAYQWAVMLLTATLLVGIWVIFKKGFEEREKLLCGMGIIIMVITPLGSNNHLYSSINNLFFIAPFTLWMLYRFWRYLPEYLPVRKFQIASFPLKGMLMSMFVMGMLQCTIFGWVYVFVETGGGKNMNTCVEENAILEGMLTDATRVKQLKEISAYVQEQGLQGQEVILYGQIPAMSYYLEMPFAISSWPDLASYNYSVMVEDLQEIEREVLQNGETLPVILMEKKQGTFVQKGREGLVALGTVSEPMIEKIIEDKKLTLLSEMIEKHHYQVTFENDKFVLFMAGAEGE